MDTFLSFHLDPLFVAGAVAKLDPGWGYPIGNGLSLGEITYIDKYSRKRLTQETVDYWRRATAEVIAGTLTVAEARAAEPAGGSKERWHDTIQRVVEGVFSILKDHCNTHQTPWDEDRAQRAAQEMFELAYTMKWLPPGRGLWMMGTEFVHRSRNSASLQNCAMVSTADFGQSLDSVSFLMEASMLGVGVGFDVRGAGSVVIARQSSRNTPETKYVIDDTREGWVNSVVELLSCFLDSSHQRFQGASSLQFDYSNIRPAGLPILGFGGTAAGPAPLKELHESLRRILTERAGQTIDSRTIVDIMNIVGRCVVAGNVRRSAEVAFGDMDDKDFVSLKNWDLPQNAERMSVDGWGGVSNNSVFWASQSNIPDHIIDSIVVNGEPGLLNLDLARQYGRLVDGPDNKDYRVIGANPCVEQSLEDRELCTLVEVFPSRCDDREQFLRAQKYAYLYAKAVTLLPTHWPKSNEVMVRNRRIGASLTGQADFIERNSWAELREWMDAGYEHICYRDRQYSEWLGVRESIKKTSVKPSGTVSILAGCSPGAHWPLGGSATLRSIIYDADDAIVQLARDAGVTVVPWKDKVRVEWPIRFVTERSQADVSIWEKAKLAAMAQRWWADNMVSVTLSFDKKTEADQIAAVIHSFDGELKALSFLGMDDDTAGYDYLPYQPVTEDEIDARRAALKPASLESLYGEDAADAVGERFCTTDVCLL